MNDYNFPDCGGPDGRARLVQRVIEAFERTDRPKHERQSWIAEIEVTFGVAIEATRAPITRL